MSLRRANTRSDAADVGYERAERAAIAEFNEAKKKEEAATDAVNEARGEARKLKSDSDVLNLAFI